MKKSIYATLLTTLLFVPLLVGCGGSIKTNEIVLEVTIDGKPLEGASVSLVPKDSDAGMKAFGKTDAQGKCMPQTLHGKVKGGTTAAEYIVTVSKIETVKTGRKIKRFDGELEDEETGKETISEKYTDSKTSPLGITVVSGKNVFPLALESEK